MPLRKVIVGNEGDDDDINKKSINDALSWLVQKFNIDPFSTGGRFTAPIQHKD